MRRYAENRKSKSDVELGEDGDGKARGEGEIGKISCQTTLSLYLHLSVEKQVVALLVYLHLFADSELLR